MKKLLRFAVLLFIFFVLSLGFLLFFSPKPELLKKNNFSKAVYDANHQLLRLTLSPDEKFRLYRPLNKISPQLIEATLLQEDRYFFRHFGLNPLSLLQAFWQTYVMHTRRQGASTISMQLARMVYGIQSKKVGGKLEQIFRALQIERHYTKNQILEAYLNLAPYGGNIEGVEAASLIYFNKSSNQLSLPELLTLSIIPQNPVKRTIQNNQLKNIRNQLFLRWVQQFPQDYSKKMMFDLPLVMRDIHHLPFYAPHFVNKIIKENPSNKQDLETSLDNQTQMVFEKIVQHYLWRKKNLGVYNAAVLLVDTRTMEVQSLIGSANFFNRSIGGQINGVDIKRSPGSTLKPFIYGLALDQGLIHPNTVLKDVPKSFNGYNPENFDYDFMGPVKAKDALILSRNIPAVDLSNQLHDPNLYELLESAQVSELRAESYYGLALNLGGAELTMIELVSLYAMLVNGGLWHPLNFFKDKEHSIPKKSLRLLSPEASFLVLDMLKNTTHLNLDFTKLQFPISWKTGTSSGYRDGWTLGSYGPFVLGVWIGNFDNQSNPAFVGKDIAAPLFFELIEALQQRNKLIDFRPPHPDQLNLKKIEVCKISGLLPTPYCFDKEKVWFIPGKSPIKTDTIFREVAINSKTGLRTCHINKWTRFEIFEFWPSDLLKIFSKAGIHRHTPPFFEPDCALSDNKGLAPQITSPQTGINYIVRVNNAQGLNKIPLSAITESGVSHLYWFVNETFLGKTSPNKSFLWQAKPGSFVVRVVDDRGLSDAVKLRVVLNN